MSYLPRRGGSDVLQEAPLTIALIVANVFVYILQESSSGNVVVMDSGTSAGAQPVLGSVDGNFGLWGPMVSSGEWWRLLTSGFMHASILHIASNMLALYFIGRSLEPALGWLRLGSIYFGSLAAGSLGVMVWEPGAFTMGASGAIFGLMGAFVVIARARGINFMESGIGTVILLNLVITFTIPNISKGGHIGGLIGGAAIAYAMTELEKRRLITRVKHTPFVALSLVAFFALLVISIVLARSEYPSMS